jgi:hypothetical protein
MLITLTFDVIKCKSRPSFFRCYVYSTHETEFFIEETKSQQANINNKTSTKSYSNLIIST